MFHFQALLQHIGNINTIAPLLPAQDSVLPDSAFSVPLKKGTTLFSSFSGAFATYWKDQCHRAASACTRLCFARFCVFRTAEKGLHPFCSYFRHFCNISAMLITLDGSRRTVLAKQKFQPPRETEKGHRHSLILCQRPRGPALCEGSNPSRPADGPFRIYGKSLKILGVKMPANPAIMRVRGRRI